MDVEQHIPKRIPRVKSIIKKDTFIKFYNEKEQQYLDTDASGIGLRAGLLQVRGGMQFPKDEEHNNSVLWLLPFAS